jgi:hypothetical protein
MTRRLRLVALAAVALLALSACASNDAKRSDVVNAMVDAGLSQEQADCIGDGFDEAFADDQDLYNDVAAATETNDFPEGTEDTIDGILTDCVGEAGESAGTDDEGDAGTGDEGDTGDSTDTTDGG